MPHGNYLTGVADRVDIGKYETAWVSNRLGLDCIPRLTKMCQMPMVPRQALQQMATTILQTFLPEVYFCLHQSEAGFSSGIV